MNYLIIADGDYQSPQLIKTLMLNKTVIALDGSYSRLKNLDIKPDIVLGDMDTLQVDLQELSKITKVIKLPDQNTTDLQKAIIYCDQHNAEQIDIVCALGGRVDHTLVNLRVLRKYYRKQRSIILHTDTQQMQFVRDQKITIHGKIGDYCAIMAFPQGQFSSHGLKYDVINFPLEFGESESACNQLASTQALLNIQGDALLITTKAAH
ncbi:MAG: thiamine diphosphokinase [Gammaproteobacteria bacterium]